MTEMQNSTLGPPLCALVSTFGDINVPLSLLHEIPIFEAEEQRALTSESFVTAEAVNPDS